MVAFTAGGTWSMATFCPSWLLRLSSLSHAVKLSVRSPRTIAPANFSSFVFMINSFPSVRTVYKSTLLWFLFHCTGRISDLLSPQIASMAERITSRLRPDRETMRLFPHGHAFHFARCCVDSIDHIVKAAGKPELLSVGAYVTHIGTAAAGNWPRGQYFMRGEVDD